MESDPQQTKRCDRHPTEHGKKGARLLHLLAKLLPLVEMSQAGTCVERSVRDALERFRHEQIHWSGDVDVYTWPQTRMVPLVGSRSRQPAAITTVQATVVGSRRTGAACIYFDGEFAYRLEEPNDTFFERMADHRLPFAWERWTDLEGAVL